MHENIFTSYLQNSNIVVPLKMKGKLELYHGSLFEDKASDSEG